MWAGFGTTSSLPLKSFLTFDPDLWRDPDLVGWGDGTFSKLETSGRGGTLDSFVSSGIGFLLLADNLL